MSQLFEYSDFLYLKITLTKAQQTWLYILCNSWNADNADK